MRADPQHKNWDIPEKIDWMSAFMAYMTRAERKALIKLGAVRLSRKDAIKFLNSLVSTQNYHT
eukprot:10745790-Heterocapsa_arctica.AAC.1